MDGQQSQRINIYQTGEHPCSYLPGRIAVTQFIDPNLLLPMEAVEHLAELGFRRSGDHIYTPSCPGCSSCVSVRVKVKDFKPNRTQRKVLNRNQDLRIEVARPELSLEVYRLYRQYINHRHSDGDMYPPSARQLKEFLCIDTGYSSFWKFYDGKKLLGIAVTDHFSKGLASVYSFFCPYSGKRSLGVYFVLRQILAAREAGLDYLYLGYLIEGCRKMSYKSNFGPLEHLDHDTGTWKVNSN
ncbi:arginyltransferase [Sansalvadorimonas sp. 2012CJ34-2]|uniref:Aspartate/glutamate leucyltransferase n=1 Tax=Parendozoicomonas callyspongiae TaxID=2942213 RepID=A0ABT0PHB5_9GAMM|nr:arginyltransferase [Sansalvadorimonas sp. 2012CJ34-2]MCL6269893.1 arginyltransferase [Sansalvadorimonas sp. 2012CJ34-2]